MVWYFLSYSSASPKNSITASTGTNSTTIDTKNEIKSTTCQIIALGDSITAGYELATEKAYPAQLEALLQEKGYTCTVVNAGVSGDTSKGLHDRIDFTIGDTPYTLAILTI